MPHFPAPRHATRESTSPTGRSLQIFVLFNGVEASANALRQAGRFAADLGGEILVAAPLVVPYPLPLQCPDVNRHALCAHIRQSVAQSGVGCDVQKVIIGYARDYQDGWRSLLPPGCIVVVGREVRFSAIQRFQTWRTARCLRRMGYEVLVA